MLIYHNKYEYSRVVEIVDVTEEGTFLQDGAPEDYGGAVLQVEVVHHITFTDSAGCLEVLRLNNPTPLDKNKAPSPAAITIDGKPYREGASPARRWETLVSDSLPTTIKEKAEAMLWIMNSDGNSGTEI
jgi:hypothetical protein